MTLFSKNPALSALFAKHGEALCRSEGLSPDTVREHINRGTMVLLGNPAHPGVRPVLVGQPSRIKVNANIGTSPLRNDAGAEMAKLAAALEAGADTVMDLSIAGDLDAIRSRMLAECPAPVGTVPLYAAAQGYISADRDPSALTTEDILGEIRKQAAQGVDFMTVHCGLTARAAAWATDEGSRVLGIVSRGGSILARWIRVSGQENPFLTHFDAIVSIAREYNVTLSLGDGLRPGAGSDAGDAAQWDEVIMLGQLARRAREQGVQCLIEGPGHVRLHEVETQIRGIKTLCNGAPLYVLGPLVIDSCPGYDHIAGAIGAAAAVRAGADFLCYLTPAEHLTLPDLEDVRAGVMASRIAAQAGEVALGRAHALEREASMSVARAALDWPGMQDAALDPGVFCAKRAEHANEDVCAMCGDYCAVRMLQD
ncbi:phosphomethylpyrimidine synthase ThiC [Phaeovibrio sulfidiphilus]|uniref:Phosphomethylpyrimidine synthase n=1 Tax=Phaeovibrio sulfidiphilus TaxID=1220600 RepID=A0A8J6YPB1_9PROT|nr:phosphomethylpyrimidine synthase ThiC [Phaeovibrio sulfidiphilus]MBE1237524.1 phosphomethylpyrimidine synthase ThiC [Phaeovibrio sulfidiphilus]